jgi:hypothetical protein
MAGSYGNVGPGSPMPAELAKGLETLTGVSLDNVRVHYNSLKPVALGAKSLTEGNDIHLGPGQERCLPHEAWRVVQQRQGRVGPGPQRSGTAINDNPALENEAEWMATRAVHLYMTNTSKT